MIQVKKEASEEEVRAPDYYGIIHEWWYVGEIKAQHISEIEVQNYLLTNPIGYKYDEAEKLLCLVLPWDCLVLKLVQID